jgi:hypothetical protein
MIEEAERKKKEEIKARTYILKRRKLKQEHIFFQHILCSSGNYLAKSIAFSIVINPVPQKLKVIRKALHFCSYVNFFFLL